MLFLVLGLPILSIYLIVKGKGSYLRIIGIIIAIVHLTFFTWIYWDNIFTPEGYCDDPNHAYNLICEPGAGLVEQMSYDREKYQAFFDEALKKFGVKSTDELDDDKIKEFYDYLNKEYEENYEDYIHNTDEARK